MKKSPFLGAAFALLEIMLVVLIIALLACPAVWAIVDKRTKIKDFNGLATQLMVYQASNGFLPTTEQGLKALVTRPESDPKPLKWRQYIPSLPLDPWGSEYRYVQPGRHNPKGYDLSSAGEDRIHGTADDIGNW